MQPKRNEEKKLSHDQFHSQIRIYVGVVYMLDENWSHKDTVKISTVNGIDVRYRTKSLFAYLFSTQKPNFFAGKDAKLFFSIFVRKKVIVKSSEINTFR